MYLLKLNPKPVLFALVFLCVAVGANPATAHPVADSVSIANDPLIKRLDSMAALMLTRDRYCVSDKDVINCVHLPAEAVPHYTEAQILEKMKQLPYEVPMVLNPQVKQFIDLFAYRRRGLMARSLANGQVYFPIFEEVLDRRGLPEELKYLPVIESAFNPVAVSRAGATGLWQLMHGTGTLMGLEVNSYVDERRDPQKSTEAAVKYLERLYNMYGDWHLVLAAYNSGPGNVNKAIARSGGKRNFWAIMPYLPSETRSYVPIYIAATYVLSYYDDFKLLSPQPRRDLYAVDTVHVAAKVSLKHIATVLGISEDELQFLNPSLKKGMVPYVTGGHPLNLPVGYFARYEAMKEAILNDTSAATISAPAVVSTPAVVYHKIRNNETLGAIAAKYKVSVTELKRWNGLRNSYIYAGQKLKIHTTKVTEAPTAPGYAAVFAPRSFERTEPDSVGGVEALDTEIAGNVDTEDDGSEETAEEGSSEEVTEGEAKEGAVETEQNTGAEKPAAQPAETGTNTGKQLSSIDEKCGCVYHVVQPGDTLWNIAKKYDGVTVEKLKADNQTAASRLKVGDILKIFVR